MHPSCDAQGMRVGTGDGSLVITWVSDAGQSPQPAQHWFDQAGLDAEQHSIRWTT